MGLPDDASELPPPVRFTQPQATPKKRPAPATRNLNDIWDLEAVRKKSRRGKVYASVSDICREMETGDAIRKKKHLDEWMPTWASKRDWADSSWDNFAKFGRALAVDSKELELLSQCAQTSTTFVTNLR